MPNDFMGAVEKPQTPWKRKLRRAGRELQIWNRTLISSLIEMMILGAATMVISMAVLSFIKAMWHLYLQTPVGHKFASNACLLSNYTLAQLLSKDLMFFSIEISVTTIIACLLLSAICQLLAVRRLFYEGRGLANRIMWLMVFMTFSADILTSRSQLDFSVAVGLCMVPTMCLFATCLAVSERLLPKLTPAALLELTRKFIDFMTRPE
jgi:hypothetical protein